jgi:hypothetical protein
MATALLQQGNQRRNVRGPWSTRSTIKHTLTSPLQMRLPPEVNRCVRDGNLFPSVHFFSNFFFHHPFTDSALYVRNLPFKITAEEMYDIFGKFGTIRQIRVGVKPETRGTVRAAFVHRQTPILIMRTCNRRTSCTTTFTTRRMRATTSRALTCVAATLSCFTTSLPRWVWFLFSPSSPVAWLTTDPGLQAHAKVDLVKKKEDIEKMKQAHGL